MKKNVIGLSLLLLVVFSAQAFDGNKAIVPGQKWRTTTRINYRLWQQGQYIGHVDREIRETYQISDLTDKGWLVSGEARILGNIKKNGLPVAARLIESMPVNYRIEDNGKVDHDVDGYPRLQGFPSFPEKNLKVGDKWQADLGMLMEKPDSQTVVLKQTANYTYISDGPYMGRKSHFFDVSWTVTDHQIGILSEHSARLVVDAQKRTPVMARDRYMEKWLDKDGLNEQREGFALIFWNPIEPLNANLDKHLSDQGIEFTHTPQGLSITLHDLHFEADKTVLIQKDMPALNNLAKAIMGMNNRTILVRGHTADVGHDHQQNILSEERAKSVSDRLIQLGIQPRRLIYEGVGAKEPVASNSTEEGRRKNRRVEFVILED